MKQIQLNHGNLELPTDWSELTTKQRMSGFRWLAEMIAGDMEPFIWQCRMLVLLTGYRPSRRRSPDERQNISLNLVHLAQAINFAFYVENDDHGNTTVKLNYDMHDCPVSCRTYFRRERIIETNMTARQYADGVELLEGINQSTDAQEREYYQDKLCKVLGVADCDNDDVTAVRLAVQIWFTGIVLFWQHHPVYSVLYESNSKPVEDESHISLGLQEVLLELTEKGYQQAGDMLVTDFFDAQVKMLRDRLQEAKSSGVKLPELVQKTGIPLKNITRLV